MMLSELEDTVYGLSIYAGWLSLEAEDASYEMLDEACRSMDPAIIAEAIAQASSNHVINANDVQTELQAALVGLI